MPVKSKLPDESIKDAVSKEEVKIELPTVLTVNPKYAGTDWGEHMKKMIDIYLDSESKVTPESPATTDEWTLLHEATKAENIWSWRKKTGIASELFVKNIILIEGKTPEQVMAGLTIE